MDNDFPESSVQSLSPCPNSEDSFGNPVKVPRVGCQYQAQIPSAMIEDSSDSDVYYNGLPVSNENGSDDSGLSSLPISPCRPWKAIEHESFLVGLYIFGKNLKNVKKFVRSKQMGEILLYYYGTFYKSKGYNRWYRGRKMKRKDSIRGEKIFAGWRRQELLSRLLLHATEKSECSLREIFMEYEEDKVSLEKYVFTLKRIVGIEALLEAIALGKGMRDLTRSTLGPKNAQNLPSQIPKIPRGKALSSLTVQEIVQFLTEIRLNKDRSNDLFWEAVWPRLLANGWRSEQPKDYALFSSKRSIVFIIPGIEKFSRRMLVKGNHYFDSVIDVLNKVASEPSLLEGTTEEEMETENIKTVFENSRSPESRKSRSYLQPPVSSGNMVTFTIVDTSLRYEGERSKVVELRTLPVDMVSDISILSDFPSDPEQESSQEDINKSEDLDYSPKSTNIPDNSTDLAPIIRKEFMECKLNEQYSHTDLSDFYENTESQVCPSLYISSESDSSLARESSETDEEDIDCSEHKSRTMTDLNLTSEPQKSEANGSLVKNVVHDHGDSDTSSKIATAQVNEQAPEALTGGEHKLRTMTDLNLTLEPQESEANGSLVKNVVHDHGDSDTSSKIATSQVSEQSPEALTGGRRQSTRNRPLTTKALEAIAYGFIGPCRKRKNIETRDGSRSLRPPRLARGRGAESSTFDSSSPDDGQS